MQQVSIAKIPISPYDTPARTAVPLVPGISQIPGGSTDPFDFLETVEKEGKKFRIQNLRLHITYKTHLDPNEWLAWFSLKGHELVEYSIVREKSPKNGYLHTHILIRTRTMITTTSPRYFDFNDIHPNIKTVKTDEHWRRTVEYHRKDGDPVTMLQEGTIAEDIWKHDSVGEALVNACGRVRDAGGIIAIFNHKPVDYGEEPAVVWKPWQKSLYDELGTTPDSRRILWYWDPKGDSGKTFFAKHMGMYKGAFTSTKANTYHLATMIQDRLKAGKSSVMVIFNFTRQSECNKVYAAIESLKDGMITAEKYHGEPIYFDSPHVVVFANYLPDFSAVSIDRWHLRVINKEGLDLLADWSNKMIEQWIADYVKQTGASIKEASKELRMSLVTWGKQHFLGIY